MYFYLPVVVFLCIFVAKCTATCRIIQVLP